MNCPSCRKSNWSISFVEAPYDEETSVKRTSEGWILEYEVKFTVHARCKNCGRCECATTPVHHMFNLETPYD
jgi:hypothetical protein